MFEIFWKTNFIPIAHFVSFAVHRRRYVWSIWYVYDMVSNESSGSVWVYLLRNSGPSRRSWRFSSLNLHPNIKFRNSSISSIVLSCNISISKCRFFRVEPSVSFHINRPEVLPSLFAFKYLRKGPHFPINFLPRHLIFPILHDIFVQIPSSVCNMVWFEFSICAYELMLALRSSKQLAIILPKNLSLNFCEKVVSGRALK